MHFRTFETDGTPYGRQPYKVMTQGSILEYDINKMEFGPFGTVIK